jgi:hypothetical protein
MINSRKMKQMEHLTRVGEMINAYKILVAKPDVNKSLGRAKRIWENNTKMDLEERDGRA